MTLPRRPFLGAAVRPAEGGLEITWIAPGSMAAQTLRVGDVLEAMDAAPVPDVEALRRALGSEGCVATLRRDGARHEVRLAPVPFPDERGPGALTYGALDVGGHRVRTILRRPSPDAPVLLFLPGIRPESVDFALAERRPAARLVHGLVEAGFAVLRVDRFGLGDSEGPPCAGIDLETERTIYAAALDALGQPAFLFGHSVGGMLAPLLARDREVLGVATFGTSARRWTRCLRDGIARQLRLRGRDEATVRRELEAFDADPLRDGRYDRTRAFHAQLDAAPLEEAWRALDAPCLFLVGEHDWVVSEEEQREAASFAGGEVRVLPGVDHAFTRHETLAESLERYGEGAFAAELVHHVAAWRG